MLECSCWWDLTNLTLHSLTELLLFVLHFEFWNVLFYFHFSIALYLNRLNRVLECISPSHEERTNEWSFIYLLGPFLTETWVNLKMVRFKEGSFSCMLHLYPLPSRELQVHQDGQIWSSQTIRPLFYCTDVRVDGFLSTALLQRCKHSLSGWSVLI